jgi:hypothetical protein
MDNTTITQTANSQTANSQTANSQTANSQTANSQTTDYNVTYIKDPSFYINDYDDDSEYESEVDQLVLIDRAEEYCNYINLLNDRVDEKNRRILLQLVKSVYDNISSK